MKASRSAPAAALLLGLLGMDCGRHPRPNLVLVTIDTLRADRLSGAGPPRGTMPSLDRLAASGVRFSDAYTTAPITAPAHASLFTGRYPLGHGVRTNGLYILSPSELTLAERLADAGYLTAAFVGGVPLDHRFGFAQGFATYDDDFSRSVLRGSDLSPWYQTPIVARERRADEVMAPALDWLKENHARPFFLWVHLFDPHSPYAPPPPYDRRFYRGADPRDPDNHTLDPLWRHPESWHGWLTGITDAAYVEALYDGEVAFADHELGELLEALRRLGHDQDTVVAVLGDHGEGMGEHGEYYFHGDLVHEPTLRIPFVLKASGRIPPGRVSRTRARGVDLLPTLLELLGLKPAGDVDGESLIPDLEGDVARPVLAEAAYRDRSERALYAYLEGPLKLVVAEPSGERGAGLACYDLARDPGETRSICDEEPAAFAPLRARFEVLRRRGEARQPPGTEVPREVIEALHSLGYAH